MTPQPMTTIAAPRRHGARLAAAAAARIRRPPTARHIARRQLAVTVTKWLLPALALALLSTMALWPEFDRTAEEARLAFQRVSSEINGAELIDATYHGIDEKGRPYTVTAATAQQASPTQVNLTSPKADITLQNGTWLMLQSKDGVYIQGTNQLDLSHDVTLYRDDGTTMVTASAAIDMKNGAAAGAQPVHAEGPFGTLDAQGGFTLVDKGAIIQFSGPAKLVLNSATANAATAEPEGNATAPASAAPAPPRSATPPTGGARATASASASAGRAR